MPWFKVDDSFYDHPKVENLSMAARGLWLTCGVWCAKHLTDGVISAKRVRALGGTPAQIKALIKNGLWSECKGDSGAKCYAFHDWFDMQPSREQIYEKREIERQKKRKQRTNQTSDNATTSRFVEMSPRDTSGDNPRDTPRDSLGLSRAPDPTRPDPTLRKKENPTKGKKERSPQSAYADEFAEWYADYPRKRSRKQAEKAFAKARKEGATVQELTEGLAKAKRSWQLEGRDSTKIPYPASWLNAEGWADEETTPQQTQPPSKAQQYLEIGQRLSQQAQQESDRQRQILEANRNATNPDDIIPPF